MNLLDRLKEINKWIEENPSITDPDMYVIMECTVELGEMANKAKVFNMPDKYPVSGELKEIYCEYNKMLEYRLPERNVIDSKNSLMSYGSPLHKLFMEVSIRSQLGEYKDLLGVSGYNKKKLLCKLVEIALGIEKRKRDREVIFTGAVLTHQEKNPLYNNKEEFDKLTVLYLDYIFENSHNQFCIYICNLYQYIKEIYTMSA
ncbi:MAG: hypothetical protein N2749_04960 [Clostridia bacterium]|nr:hypothetical protein [Clostridia bacterium]